MELEFNAAFVVTTTFDVGRVMKLCVSVKERVIRSAARTHATLSSQSRDATRRDDSLPPPTVRVSV